MLTLPSPSPALWRQFTEGRPIVELPRELLRSWTRARGAGAAFEGLPDTDGFVSTHDLDDRREAADRLRAGARTALRDLGPTLGAAGYLGLLTDPDGVILDQFGGGGFLDKAGRAQLVEGARWSESVRGTNAIGTALAEDAPVAVIGRAHLHQANHQLVCYAAPVHDPAGRIAGLIDLTGPVEAAHPFARGLAPSVAQRIEEAWRLDVYGARISGGLEPLLASLDDLREPAAFVDGGGALRHANLALRIACPDCPGVQSLTGLSWQELTRLDAERFVTRRRSGLQGRSVDVRWIEDARGQRIAAVLTARARVTTPRAEAHTPAVPAQAPGPFAALDGIDAGLQATVARAAVLARTPLSLLLLAETGTGKDVLARAIHEASPRSAGPFVAVNCGAFTASLLQSELFGYGPGAFTGALRGGRAGFVEVASGGTLFLDELADLPADAQAALLRFLEDGSYYRVGETTVRVADVRVVSATCRDLEARVADGRFREDLFHRLRGATLRLPALRERRDLPELIALFVARAARSLDLPPLPLTASADAALRAYAWPGNFRELEQAAMVAVAMAAGHRAIERHHLPDHVLERAASPPPSRTDAAPDDLDALLAECSGNVSEVARRLGVARSTIYRRIQSSGRGS